MPSRALNHRRYNFLLKPRAFDEIRWTMSPHDLRALIGPPLDPTFLLRPHHLHLKYCVELSPTREKLKEMVGLKGATDLSVSFNPNYRMLTCTITQYNTIKYKYCTRHLSATHALAWVSMARPCGLACHVASTWVPPNNYPLSCLFKLVFNIFKSKKIQKILEKSLKIRKFITFKIQLQINPDFFSLALKFNSLSL